MGLFSKDAPDPPDYAAAATAQGEANKEAAIASSMLSNPNINSPYGSQRVSYAQGPDGNWIPTVDREFSPEEQAKYDADNRITMSLYGTAEDGLGRVNDMLGTDFDPNLTPYRNLSGNYGRQMNNEELRRNLPAYYKFFSRGKMPGVDGLTAEGLPEQGDASVGGLSSIRDAITGLYGDEFAQEESQLRSDLAARGFNPGDEGWNDEMRRFDQRQNDFDLQALLSAGSEQSRINQDMRANRGQQFGERQGIHSAQGQDWGREMGLRGYLDDQRRYMRDSQFNERLARGNLMEQQRLNAFNVDRQAAQTAADIRARQYQEAERDRLRPLSEINALRTGGQPQMAQFQNFSGQNIQAAPVYQAAYDRGNFDMANFANQPDTMGQLFGFGGSVLGGMATGNTGFFA